MKAQKPEVEGLRLINQIKFYDTPKEVIDTYPQDAKPYIPSYEEWRQVKMDNLKNRVVSMLGMSFGAISLICLIVAFATKK